MQRLRGWRCASSSSVTRSTALWSRRYCRGRHGAATGLDTFCYMTVGTGIGGGAVVNGALLHGLLHPEFGHMRIPHDRERDPFDGNLFIFRGRRGDLIKMIWHDGQGACLFTKRLERGRFIWPSVGDGAVTIDVTTIDDLARLAEQHGLMIMYTQGSVEHSYFVYDGKLSYRYRITTTDDGAV